MSKAALHAFIDRARADEDFRSKLANLDPNQIIEFAGQHGFCSRTKLKGALSIDGAVFIFAPRPSRLDSCVLV